MCVCFFCSLLSFLVQKKAKLEVGLPRSRSTDLVMRKSLSKQNLGEDEVIVVVDDAEDKDDHEEDVKVDREEVEQEDEELQQEEKLGASNERQRSPVVVFVPRIPESLNFAPSSPSWSFPSFPAPAEDVTSGQTAQFVWNVKDFERPETRMEPAIPLQASPSSASMSSKRESPIEKVQSRLKKKAVSSSRLKLARQREAERAKKKAQILKKRREEQDLMDKAMPARLESFSDPVPVEYLAVKETENYDESNGMEAAFEGRFYLSKVWDKMRIEEETR